MSVQKKTSKRKVVKILFTAKDHIKLYATISLHIQQHQSQVASGEDYRMKLGGNVRKMPLHSQCFRSDFPAEMI